MDTLPKLIGLYSGCPRSGKSTAAKVMELWYGYTVLSFATPIKEMAEIVIEPFVGAQHVVAYVYGEKKDEIIPGLGVTSRHIQRTLGTEWGRTLVKKSLWVDSALMRAYVHLAAGHKVVFDDMRFPNEYAAIKEAGGQVMRVHRPIIEEPFAPTHESEGALLGKPFDHVFTNDFTLQAFEDQVTAYFDTLKEAA